MATPPLLLRTLPLLRRSLLRNIVPIASRSFCCAAADSNFTLKESPSLSTLFSPKPVNSPNYPRLDDPDYGKWKAKEAEILEDIEPTVLFTKEILHSSRYMDGDALSVNDEKIVLDKLLAHHPHSDDKIGCGLDSIMVDRHPQFRNSRCLFVVRTDGGWIDFSYQKCLRAYIKNKYPSDADRFIREHFKRSS